VNQSFGLLPDEYKINSAISNTAIISIYGIGNNVPTKCNHVERLNVYSVNINYESTMNSHLFGILDDVYTLLKDGHNLKYHNTISQDFHSHARLFKLQNAIKKFILMENLNQVILIGASHGSLIVHGAFLKLQMDHEVLPIHLAKLKIFTIGSPRYLPKGLLPNLLNFYHVQDDMIHFVKKLNIVSFISGFRVPDLAKIAKDVLQIDCNSLKHEHAYDADNALVYVNKCNFVKQGDAGKQGYNYNNYLAPYYEDGLDKDKKKYIFHSSIHNLYPIMNYDTRLFMDPKTIYLEKTDCNMSGGASKQYVKYKEKFYKLRENKKGKYILVLRAKTYLTTIRGKYRYSF
jgi:hypothetical protein